MEPSPFSEYYLRKLLSQQGDSIAHFDPGRQQTQPDQSSLPARSTLGQRFPHRSHGFTSHAPHGNYGSKRYSLPGVLELSQILAKVQPSVMDAPTCRELETLTQMYQTLESRIAFDYESLTEVKRRIFRLLDLPLSAFSTTGIPTIVQEQSVRLFWFYWSNQLREGVHYNNDLYGLIKEFNILHRSRAYQLAWALAEQKIPALLTASETRYVLWICLRSPTSTVLMQQTTATIATILSLHEILRNFRY